MTMKKMILLSLTALLIIAAAACSPAAAKETPPPQADEPEVQSEPDEAPGSVDYSPVDPGYQPKEGVSVIYLAGGCFWGTEQLMQSIPGVVEATSGYANGKEGEAANYQNVIEGGTGFRETVRVEYKPDEISLDAILFTYFSVIDPTLVDRQGNDIGTQYQTGVYYADDAAKQTVMRIAAIERARAEAFHVELEPLERFYDAEEYHQDYLEKNPNGYCHIPGEEMELAAQMVVDPGDYPRPGDEEIKEMLTDEQYMITQQSGTEAPFACEYWDHKERGLFVDIVTGEPLFSSSDKFDSGTGWPSFSRAVDPNTVVHIEDKSHGMVRTEVRSRAGNSHLGHVFFGEAGSPNGVRYCINSAALKFVPYDEMDAQGYGYLKDYVKEHDVK